MTVGRLLSSWKPSLALPCLLQALGLFPACVGDGPNAVPVAESATRSSSGASSQSSPAAQASSSLAAAETRRARQLTRYARLLAGVDDPPAADGDPLRASEAFVVHAREMADLWTPYNTTEVTRIRPWVDINLAPVAEAQTLFYPFAGADVLFATAFFPRARTYVLVGLERVGALADLDAQPAKKVELECGRIRKAVTPLLRSTFFRTLEMQSDVLEDGVLTIVTTLLAGTRHRILKVDLIALSKDGRVTERGIGGPELTPGARIEFVNEGEMAARSLYYFRADLSDQGLAKQGGLLAFVDTLPSKVTFTKAAAYTMHGRPFSTIRDYIVTRSRAVLEDDTGVPLRYFDRATWDLRYFGSYVQPISMFRNYRQPDLAEAFAQSGNVRPLDFHVGYGSGPAASNLMLAVRRSAPR